MDSLRSGREGHGCRGRRHLRQVAVQVGLPERGVLVDAMPVLPLRRRIVHHAALPACGAKRLEAGAAVGQRVVRIMLAIQPQRGPGKGRAAHEARAVDGGTGLPAGLAQPAAYEVDNA